MTVNCSARSNSLISFAVTGDIFNKNINESSASNKLTRHKSPKLISISLTPICFTGLTPPILCFPIVLFRAPPANGLRALDIFSPPFRLFPREGLSRELFPTPPISECFDVFKLEAFRGNSCCILRAEGPPGLPEPPRYLFSRGSITIELSSLPPPRFPIPPFDASICLSMAERRSFFGRPTH